MNQLTETTPQLVKVDAGDLLFSVPRPSNTEKALADKKMELLVNAYNECGYQAVNVGINDLALGPEFIQQFTESAKFPFISANIVNTDGNRLFKPYTIIKKGDYTIGIVGVTTGNSHVENVRYLDVVKTAQQIYKDLQSQVDFTVLLASVFNPDAETLMNGELGYDLIIRSHSPRLSRTLNKARNGFFLSTGTQGRYVQVLEIRRNSGTSEISDLSLTMQRLSFIESRLNEFKQQAGDSSIDEYYQDKQGTYEFIKNLQEQHTDLQQEVRSADNYAAIKVQSLGTHITDNPYWQEQVNKVLN